MSRYLNYVFPAGNTEDVCLTQSLAGASNLALNGNLANAINSQVSFIEKGYSRQVSLASANDLSARQFTITGTQNGVLVIENIAGPNANTVFSVQFYDVINSISVNGAAVAVSIGAGHSGWIAIDVNLEKDVINCALSVSNPDTTINTILYQTGIDLRVLGQTYLSALNDHPTTFFTVSPEGTTSYLASTTGELLIELARTLLLEIKGAPGTIGETIQVIFRQT